jgi:hypothetical protein
MIISHLSRGGRRVGATNNHTNRGVANRDTMQPRTTAHAEAIPRRSNRYGHKSMTMLEII